MSGSAPSKWLPLYAAACASIVAAIESTAPHNYPGMPKGDYSPEWQSYFQVTTPLPGVDFDLGNNYAGNIGVQRPGHPDNSLFFWGFEHSNGSLTAAPGDQDDVPWAIWLQGGPGASSMLGLFFENGPMSIPINSNSTISQNPYAWSNLVDYFWIDNPVGIGYSTADADGYAADETVVAQDLVGFLENLVKVFPSLATRPFYLTGESYAGRYITYTAQLLFSMPDPPVVLSKIVVGDPPYGNTNEFEIMPTLRIIETYPQLIGYDTAVYDYFKLRTHNCGLDMNVTYPQTGGKFPTIRLNAGSNPALSGPQEDIALLPVVAGKSSSPLTSSRFFAEVSARHEKRVAEGHHVRPEERRRKHDIWKRTATPSNINSTADSWYGCYLWDEMVDYALNFTYPWNVSQSYDTFDIPDALSPEPETEAEWFLDNSVVQAALHAPLKKWILYWSYPWNGVEDSDDTSPAPMAWFDELAANATANGVQIITYVGNDDGISPHFGTEVWIQNTTFGGIQGFTRAPSTPWWDVNGNFAGIVHQERNWTYALIYGAGHEAPINNPAAVFTFVQEFVVGNNPAGSIIEQNGLITVVGGENPTMNQSAMPGQAGIGYGSYTTSGLFTYPTASVAAFNAHIGLIPMTGTGAVVPTAAP